MGEEVPLDCGVERRHHRAEPAQAEPDPDEVEAVGQDRADDVTGADAGLGEVAGHPAGLLLRLTIGELALADDSQEEPVTSRGRLLVEDLGMAPRRWSVRWLCTPPSHQRGLA